MRPSSTRISNPDAPLDLTGLSGPAARRVDPKNGSVPELQGFALSAFLETEVPARLWRDLNGVVKVSVGADTF